MLTDQQYKCIELMVAGEYTQKEIAAEIKVSEQSICAWKKIEEFRNEKERILRESFADIAPTCKKELYKLATKAESEQVKLNAIKDILDRAGLKPTDKTESKNINENNNVNSLDADTSDKIAQLLDRLSK